jgi:hypothetical protein
VAELPKRLVLEVETNGTISPHPALLERVNQWNVSPKLENSGQSRKRRLKASALQVLGGHPGAWLKLVVQCDADVREAGELVRHLAWPKERVLLMAQAARREELLARTPWLLEASAKAGFAASPRLHIEQHDGQRGV